MPVTRRARALIGGVAVLAAVTVIQLAWLLVRQPASADTVLLETAAILPALPRRNDRRSVRQRQAPSDASRLHPSGADGGRSGLPGTPPLVRAPALFRQGVTLARFNGEKHRCPQPVADNTALMQRLCTNGTVALLVVAHDAPQSFAHSLATWEDSGLLDLVDERVLWLNKAGGDELLQAQAAGFTVASPAEPAHVGSSLMAALRLVQSEVVLFLEKDFAVRRAEPQEPGPTQLLRRELQAAVQALFQGTDFVRLRYTRDPDQTGVLKPCEGSYPPANGFGRHAGANIHNWFYINCMNQTAVEAYSYGRIQACGGPDPFGALRYVCYGAKDSTYSNNAAMFRRSWMLNFPLAHEAINDRLERRKNAAFELTMLRWGSVPGPELRICSSLSGPFIHHEVDG